MTNPVVLSEEATLKFWCDINAFEESLKLNKDKPEFIFYDGPPFATGLPHYGHLLAGTIKDVVCRWKHQTGYNVPRRFGWDCHGLPVEFEIEKLHGIKSSKDVDKIGIKQYNTYCRDIVMKYSREWETIITRSGRWIDFKNNYKTMDLSYMSAVWSVFSKLWYKNLIYKGYKVMPYSIGCSTVLSNSEAKMNYKNVSDPAITVKFKCDELNVSLLVYTTTPWTLFSNVAICVREDIKYVKVQVKDEYFIIAKNRLCQLGKNIKYDIIKEFTGTELVNLSYTPLFNYQPTSFYKIVADNYVSETSGTGLVHIAPAFGEDDYRVCVEKNIINKGEELFCPVDKDGNFTDSVDQFKGVMVKDADKDIIRLLKTTNKLYKSESIYHNYPYCWRSDKPLIYRAISSWFVNVEQIKSDLLDNNAKTRWTPDEIRTGRFNNWLKDARDWAVSRGRYWGTPLPIWVSDDNTQCICVESVQYLRKLSDDETINDLHRDTIDSIMLPDPRGDDYPKLKRVPEVFDCWFESGSMPYATSETGLFKRADFIAEGIDQTRGWFYTLMVLSTALDNEPAFNNLIVNGLVLAKDGNKMSKSKNNYEPVSNLINKYGADAVRLYLIGSPAAKGNDLKFKESDVKAISGDIHIPLYSALNFFDICYSKYLEDGGTNTEVMKATSDNVMDKWALTISSTYYNAIANGVEKYQLGEIVLLTIRTIDNLTNWYIRLNRPRMKDTKECKFALNSLRKSMQIISYTLASFAPFVAEHIFQFFKERNLLDKEYQQASIHYLSELTISYKDPKVCSVVDNIKDICVMIRNIRDVIKRPNTYPIKNVKLFGIDNINILTNYIKQECNVLSLEIHGNEQNLIKLLKSLKLNNAAIGRTFGSDSKTVKKLIDDNTADIIASLEKNGTADINGHCLTLDHVSIIEQLEENIDDHKISSINGKNILVDVSTNNEMYELYIMQEIFSKSQQTKKKNGYKPGDLFGLVLETNDAEIAEIYHKNKTSIELRLDCKLSINENGSEKINIHIV